tara:strand:+ start:1486 stop:1644 length:159 start_codon:yes stop_codon:yes gene_type:complete
MSCDIAAIWKMLSYTGVKLQNIEQMSYDGQENCVYLCDGKKWFKVIIMAELP